MPQHDLGFDGGETAMHKSAPAAMTLADLEALSDGRLMNAVENAVDHPIARKRAYNEELLQLVKESLQIQRGNVAVQKTAGETRQPVGDPAGLRTRL